MPGKKPHRQRAEPRWKQRMAAAATADERLAVAYGRLTADLVHLRRAKRPDPAVQARDTATAGRLADEAVAYLMDLAGRAEGRDLA